MSVWDWSLGLSRGTHITLAFFSWEGGDSCTLFVIHVRKIHRLVMC